MWIKAQLLEPSKGFSCVLCSMRDRTVVLVPYSVATTMWARVRRTISERRHKTRARAPLDPQSELIFQNSLRSLKTRSMILSDLDWRSKSVDIIHGMPAGQGTHVLSVQKLTNIGDIEETVKRQVRRWYCLKVSGNLSHSSLISVEGNTNRLPCGHIRSGTHFRASFSNFRFRGH